MRQKSEFVNFTEHIYFSLDKKKYWLEDKNKVDCSIKKKRRNGIKKKAYQIAVYKYPH